MKKQYVVIAASVVIGIIIVVSASIINDSTSNDTQQTDLQINNSITITKQQLAEADGKNGNKCYVLLDTTVYEIKQGNKWNDGEHSTSDGQAYCGADMTEIINNSPHGNSILSLLNEVGTIVQQ